MEDKKILIVPKITKVEWDLHRLGFTEDKLKEFYKKENLNVERIFESHKRQKENLERIKNLIIGATIVNRDGLNKYIINNYDLIIAVGGDNHFQYVSHFLENTPILGINSDPSRSDGALMMVSSEELEKILPNILRDYFEIENWTRLKISIDNKEIDELAISEIFIGEERRFNMSRNIIKVNGKSEEQKSSGLIIATGVGSTGWYNSACRYLFQEGDIFSKSLKEARFLLTEPHNGRLSSLKMTNGSIGEDEEIEIISLSDSSAYISIDSLKLIKLREGAKIKISIGEPLRVIRPK